MADTSYIIDLILQAKNQATAELNKVGTSIDQIKEKSVKLSDSAKTALKAVGATATAVATSVIAVGKKAVDSAVKMEPIKNSFERLSEEAGIASDEMLKTMQKASKGTVSDFDLMSAANKAYTLNVVKNTDDMAVLLEWARLKWQAMGETLDQALEDIVTWLGRWSVQILDNLGIVVKQEEAQEKYAKMLGKTTKELTAEEKAEALQKVTLEALREELEKAGDVQLTMQERLQVARTTWENMKVTLWEALMPVLEKLLDFLQPILDKVAEFVKNNPEMVAGFMKWTAGIALVVAGLSGLALALPAITNGIAILTGPIGLVIGAIVALALAWKNNRGGIQDKTKEVIDFVKPMIEERIGGIRKFWEEHGEAIKIYLEAFWDWIKWIISTALEGIKLAFEWFFTVIGVLVDIFQGDWEGAWEKIKKFGESIAKTIDKVMTSAFGDMWQKIKDGILEAYDRVVEKIGKLVDRIEWAVQKLKNAWNSAKERVGGIFGGGTRASGWPVYQWQSYLVWENGPEMFVPSQNGKIVKNEDLGNGGAWGDIVVNINMGGVAVNNGADEQSLADTIAETITRQLELYKKGIY